MPVNFLYAEVAGNGACCHDGGMNESALSLQAELFGSSACCVTGSTITGQGYTPVLEACRRLLQAGFPSSTPLQAYRGDTLCLRVGSIGEAAQLTVTSAHNGRPVFASQKAEGMTVAAPPMGQKWQGATTLPSSLAA